MGDFIGPNSTLTPGIAGALVMMFTNLLYVNMGLPKFYVGMVFSALFAIFLIDKTIGWGRTSAFFIINTLTILCVAMGINSGVPAVKEQVQTTWLFSSPAYADNINSLRAIQQDAGTLEWRLKEIQRDPTLTPDQKKEVGGQVTQEYLGKIEQKAEPILPAPNAPDTSRKFFDPF